MTPVYVAVVGPGRSATGEHLVTAQQIGALLAHAGAVVLTGGMGGVMAAAARGCQSAGGTSIGLLPDRDRARASAESTYTIPTGLGELRNGLLVRAADAVIGVAPSWGTLSEVALAVRTGVPVVTLGDWGFPLSGPILAGSAAQAVALALAGAGPSLAGAGPSPSGAGPSPTAHGADEAQPGAPAPPVHHLTLSVTDIERSAAWYQALLGPAQIVRRTGPGWERVRMQWPGELVIGVTAHAATSRDDRFDHLRPGLDHVGLSCTDEAQVRAWARRFDRMGASRGPVEDVPYGWAVTGRDPDGIPVEFFAPK
jgi:uncharacterized protein (TIGR00725 family)